MKDYVENRVKEVAEFTVETKSQRHIRGGKATQSKFKGLM